MEKRENNGAKINEVTTQHSGARLIGRSRGGRHGRTTEQVNGEAWSWWCNISGSFAWDEPSFCEQVVCSVSRMCHVLILLSPHYSRGRGGGVLDFSEFFGPLHLRADRFRVDYNYLFKNQKLLRVNLFRAGYSHMFKLLLGYPQSSRDRFLIVDFIFSK